MNPNSDGVAQTKTQASDYQQIINKNKLAFAYARVVGGDTRTRDGVGYQPRK